MKKILTTLAFSIFTLIVSAQIKCGNFVLTDKCQVIWQKVIETDKTPKEITEYFKNCNSLDRVKTHEHRITGVMLPVNVMWKELGLKRMCTTMYLVDANLIGNFLIEIKDNRYRVTLTNIKINTNTSVGVTGGGITFSRESAYDDVNKYFIKGNNKGFRNRFKNVDARTVDYTFSEVFKMKEQSKINDDW